MGTAVGLEKFQLPPETGLSSNILAPCCGITERIQALLHAGGLAAGQLRYRALLHGVIPSVLHRYR